MPLKSWQVLLAGVIATMSMDVLTAIAIRLRLIAPLSPNLVGRWFASVVGAHPFHEDIARAAPRTHELAFAVLGHYAIGMFLTAVFVLVAHRIGWQAEEPVTRARLRRVHERVPVAADVPRDGVRFLWRARSGGHALVRQQSRESYLLWIGSLDRRSDDVAHMIGPQPIP